MMPSYLTKRITSASAARGGCWGNGCRYAVAAALLACLFGDVNGQETLPIPTTANAPAPMSLPSVTIHPHPPKPSVVQTLASAKRSACAHFRASPIGKLAAGFRKPLSTLTGGMVPSEKAPHPDEQMQPGPEGTAAQIKTVEVQAPKRQAAVQALQKVDIRYHPEAEGTLVGALRADPSDCVRLEAAKTIAGLPVCSKSLCKALEVSVAGTDVDGNPGEMNPAVRTQASIASHCQLCAPQSVEPADQRPEYPDSPIQQASVSVPVDGQTPMVLPIASIIESQELASQMAYAPSSGLREVESGPIQFNRPNTNESVDAGRSGAASAVRPLPQTKPRPTNLLDVFRAASAK
ncbi:MAG: hypothetical protein R3C05_06305 [Pirellulaceae bacterium]